MDNESAYDYSLIYFILYSDMNVYIVYSTKDSWK